MCWPWPIKCRGWHLAKEVLDILKAPYFLLFVKKSKKAKKKHIRYLLVVTYLTTNPLILSLK